MSDDRYQKHLDKAVPMPTTLRLPIIYQVIIDACLLHRYGSLPTRERMKNMTFYLTGASAAGWRLSILDGLEFMTFTVIEVFSSILVRGGGRTQKVSRFSKKTLARIP